TIITILIGLVVPGLNQLRFFARKVAQLKQFQTIGSALHLFNAEWQDYPRSSSGYSGATELAKAMVGEDLKGYSIFNNYEEPIDLSSRRLYLPPANSNAHRLRDLYEGLDDVDAKRPILCDVYPYAMDTGIGMPILYYRANTAARSMSEIYNYADNEMLVGLGTPWAPGESHRLDEARFYEQIQNKRVDLPWTPQRMDSFILMSAGVDGEYGTEDDLFNF
ncbi:unnamed protein product, partial [marine sediment metagenome]